jgi:3-methyl-2-oxobutanoate hydroxymethyltransferase
MITCYDAMTAQIFDDAGFPALLVGDSAAMVVYGYSSTLPVTTAMLLPLVAAVERGSKRAMVIADLPFGSYQESPAQALATATRFMKEGNAHAVKIEGGARMAPTVKTLTASGIPVVGHIGLTPQSVHQLGGYRVQGRGESADQLLQDALALEEAGACAIVLEVVPQELAKQITEALHIPTIGIGAGADTDAQVIVWQDLLGLTGGTLYSLTLTGSTPLLATGLGVPVGGLTFTGAAPSAVVGVNRTVPVGALALTGSTATIGRALEVAVGTLTLAGQAPTLGGQTVIAVPSGTLTLTGQDATLARALVTPVGALTLTGVAPSLAYATGPQPTTGALTLTGRAPSLGLVVAMPVGSLSLTGQTPGAYNVDYLHVSAAHRVVKRVDPSRRVDGLDPIRHSVALDPSRRTGIV